MREEFNEDDFQYEMVSSSKVDPSLLENRVMNYQGKGEVYYLISKDLEVITLFIIENNKIFSFCPDFYNYKKGKIAPYFFFKELD